MKLIKKGIKPTYKGSVQMRY